MPGPITFTQPSATAAGSISPCRFIVWNTGSGNELQVVQATGSGSLFAGVSEAWVRNAPGYGPDYTYIAISGEECPYRGPLQIGKLQLGGTVNGTVALTSNGSGQGVAATIPTAASVGYIGALSMRSGVSGDYIPVYVLPPCINPIS